MNLYKKAISLFVALILTVSLCSCSSEPKLKESFISYNKNQFVDNVFTTSSNKDMIIINLEKESSSTKPKVILTLGIGGESSANEATYEWLKLSPEERKSELKECGDLVVQYAKDNNWENDYYLYVNVCQVYDGHSVIYDYEQNNIWIPDCENTFIEMYNAFNTFYKKELESSQEGINFLVDNGLAYIKHNEVEYNYISTCNVYISDGAFKSYGADGSTMY